METAILNGDSSEPLRATELQPGEIRRREILQTAGILVTSAFAGCLDDENESTGKDDPPNRIDEYLSDARNYDGRVFDARGNEDVEVVVGAGEGGLAFDPAAIRIDSGTTVLWEWSGQGGIHNVASVEESDEEFQSDRQSSEGATFKHSFDAGGIALYECMPHAGQGMLGALEVVE
jgi:halocyanin-like protein